MSQSTTLDAPASGPPPGGRRRRVLAGLTAAAVAATTGVLLPGSAAAAVPVFPDNITIFPNRDFISIDGFIGNAGKPITVELVRGGTVIGSATGTEASTDVINAGNPAIEINHPGGICWGAGGGINATPDILPGDQVVVKLGTAAAAAAADATTLSQQVTGHSLDAAGTTLTVTGTFGADVDPTFLESRIINADLKTTDGNFRDVRAVIGPLTPDRRSPAAYSSGMTVDSPGHFVATYKFAQAATAKLADAGGFRSMSWQNLDANANRQGVTIQEDGELGGPGFGGCPAAAAAAGPASPTNVTATDGGSTTTVSWKAPTVTPGTSPIVGYTVRAVTQTAGAGGGQDEVGKRIGDPNATTATLPTGLVGKTVEVRSYTAAGESWPPAVANKPATGAPTDTTIPTITVAPPGGSYTADVTGVTFTTSEPSSVVYTLDGSDPLIAADANQAATPYTGPFTIAAKDAQGNFVPSVTLRYVAFDAVGNPSLAHTDIYKFGAASAPGAPTVKATAGNTTIDVTWTAPANAGSSPISGYKITATAQGAAAPAASTTALSSATTTSLTGLTNGTTYTVSAVATNATGDGTPGTATVALSAAPSEVLTAGAPANKANDFRVKGTSSATSGSVSLFNTLADGVTPTGAALATSPLTAAVAPATGTTYDLRARTTIAAGKKLAIVGSNGGKIIITS